MAQKPNAKKKSTANSKAKEKTTTPHDDIESLQITFYEIESWIEKTTPVLSRMTKELEKASSHFDKHRKEKKEQEKTQAPSQNFLDTKTLEKQFFDFQQQQQQQQKLNQHQQQEQTASPWKQNLIGSGATDFNLLDDPSMQWQLSFQPGNLLRLDTNITSVEQLIKAVQKIRILQSGETSSAASAAPSDSTLVFNEDEDAALELLCSSSSSDAKTKKGAYTEYLQYALTRRPMLCLDAYKHYEMNLNYLTKDISPAALNYIGQTFWDCLHPKFSSDWNTFWDRSSDPQRNQVCVDSGLALIFLHVSRHDKEICSNYQEIAGFYFNRAREEMMELFEEPPDISTIEGLLNLAMFCFICKQYTPEKMYIGLCIHMVMELGIYKTSNLPTHDLVMRKKYLKLLLILYYYDLMLSIYQGGHALIIDEDFDINFYEIATLNDTLHELNKSKPLHEQIDFDNGKTLVKESCFVHTVELARLMKRNLQLIERGASVKQLLEQGKYLEQWRSRVPAMFDVKLYDYNYLEQLKTMRDAERDITTHKDAELLKAQSTLLLRIQYQSQWIIIHKAILNSIHQSTATGLSPSLSEQERRSILTCSNAADEIVKITEVINRCFGWCICQQVITALYHASTVYCGNVFLDDFELKNRAKVMIQRIMRILESCRVIYEGFPDDMTECLCEFLKTHGLHSALDCVCKYGDCSPPVLDMMTEVTTEDNNTILASLFNHRHDY